MLFLSSLGGVPKTYRRVYLNQALTVTNLSNLGGAPKHHLSYDITIFQWMMSCNKKCFDHMCINTFAGMRNVIDDVRNNNVNFQ